MARFGGGLVITSPRLRSRTELILTIVRKDRGSSWGHFLVAGIIASVAFFIIGATSAGSSNCAFRDIFPFRWDYSTIASIYAVAALSTSLSLGLAFADFHGGELRRGTIRSLILSPLDINDIKIAKLVSASLVGTATSAITFLVPTIPLVASCFLPGADLVAIYLTALGATLLILVTAAFATHLAASLWGRLWPSPSGAVGLLLLLAVLFTQTALNAMGLMILRILEGSTGRPVGFETFTDLWNIAGGIALVSPHHAFASLLSLPLGGVWHFPDVYFVLPVAAFVIAYGYLAGRSVPLDVFIR